MQHFVARQPIFDRQLNLFAYELLFRSGFHNFYNGRDGDEASSDVLTTTFVHIGLDELTSGKKASINFTRSLLVQEVATLFPKDVLLVEILEDITPDAELITACTNLKKAGYCLILDDFCPHLMGNPLLELVDIVKIDFRRTKVSDRRSIPHELSRHGIRFLAEKVEDMQEFREALKWDYSYFQGYFFCRPVIHSSSVIPGSKLVYLRIVNEVNRPDADFDKIESIIKQDVSLSYNLLKLINSAYFGLRNKIHSIKHALSLLGLHEIKKWISISALSSLAEDKPEELIRTALIRARLCEEIAPKVGLTDRVSELFLMGMFSLIDAIIDKPMSEILAKLPLTEETKTALMGGENKLRDVYETLAAYERGDWSRFSACAAELNLDESIFPELYHDAVRWVNQILQVGEPVAQGRI